jgi:hypothetical protein
MESGKISVDMFNKLMRLQAGAASARGAGSKEEAAEAAKPVLKHHAAKVLAARAPAAKKGADPRLQELREAMEDGKVSVEMYHKLLHLHFSSRWTTATGAGARR